MPRQVMEGSQGTSVVQRFPWGIYVSARLLCPDGKVRATSRLSATADTFFSVPCAVKVNGKTVAGYMTTGEDDNGNRYYAFRPYLYRKNHTVFSGA